jgi:hypothetical protein
MKKLTYSQIREQLQNGDVVLFRGKGFTSTSILWFSSLGYVLNPLNWHPGFVVGIPTRYSHTGTIVRVSAHFVAYLTAMEKLPEHVISARAEEGKEDIILLLESTSINGGFKGVQLRLFSDVIKTYKGKIRLRHLTVERTWKLRDIDCAFIQKVLGIEYEKSIVQLMRSALKLIDQVADEITLFCSELNAARFMKWEILPPRPPSNEYTPEDFRSGGPVDKRLIKASLGEEIEIIKE